MDFVPRSSTYNTTGILLDLVLVSTGAPARERLGVDPLLVRCVRSRFLSFCLQRAESVRGEDHPADVFRLGAIVEVPYAVIVYVS